MINHKLLWNSGFTDYGNACFITGGKDNYFTWNMGREWCKNNSADLVVITNEYDQVSLTDDCSN